MRNGALYVSKMLISLRQISTFHSSSIQVLFMCTANDLGNIPGPLLDRMEIVTLSGYDVPEKVQIAEQYLVPKALRESGLMMEEPADSDADEEKDSEGAVEEIEIADAIKSVQDKIPESLTIDRSAIEKLVRWYCREAGVRNLNKHIEKISRKLALQVVAEEEGAELTVEAKRKSDTWVVSEKNLEDYVGKPIFTSDRLYDKDPLPSGIVMGLAWTSMGGEFNETILFNACISRRWNGKSQLTNNSNRSSRICSLY